MIKEIGAGDSGATPYVNKPMTTVTPVDIASPIAPAIDPQAAMQQKKQNALVQQELADPSQVTSSQLANPATRSAAMAAQEAGVPVVTNQPTTQATTSNGQPAQTAPIVMTGGQTPGEAENNYGTLKEEGARQSWENAPTAGSAKQSGSGPGDFRENYTGDQSSLSGSGGAPIQTSADMANPYIDQLNNMKFAYDPTTDQTYIQAAAMLENQITQTMVGRGMLYSSVAQSALATKLSALQIEYSEIAYDRFKADRDWTFQLAQFQETRNNNAFSQQMQLAQFKADREDEAFNREMALREDARANESLYLQKLSIKAQQEQNKAKAQISQLMTSNELEKNQLELMAQAWANNGGIATAEVADYFSEYGVAVGSDMSDFYDVIQSKETEITTNAYAIAQRANELELSDLALDYITNMNYTAKETAEAGSSKDNVTTSQSGAYTQLYDYALSGDDPATSVEETIAYMTNPSTAATVEAQMGSYYYNKLLDDLRGIKKQLAVG